MFTNSNADLEETVIAEGLKIEGKVTADGLVRVNGKVMGDLRCTALVISDRAQITGNVIAEEVEVDGTVDGPIKADNVILKSSAHVTGDIQHTTLTIEKGARFEGRSKQVDTVDKKATGRKPSLKKALSSANDDTAASESAAA